MILLAACGGGTSATDVDEGDVDPTPTVTAADTDTDSDTGGGAGGDDACLNTAEEVSAAFGVEVAEAENTVNPDGDGAACIYHTDKAAFESAMATSLTTGSLAQTVFDSFASDDSAEAVSGIGDEAIWFGTNSLFIFRTGDRTLSMSAGGSVPAAGDDAAVRAILEELARTAAGRL